MRGSFNRKVVNFPNRHKADVNVYYKSLLVYQNDLNRKMTNVLSDFSYTREEKNNRVMKLGKLIGIVGERLEELKGHLK